MPTERNSLPPNKAERLSCLHMYAYMKVHVHRTLAKESRRKVIHTNTYLPFPNPFHTNKHGQIDIQTNMDKQREHLDAQPRELGHVLRHACTVSVRMGVFTQPFHHLSDASDEPLLLLLRISVIISQICDTTMSLGHTHNSYYYYNSVTKL